MLMTIMEAITCIDIIEGPLPLASFDMPRALIKVIVPLDEKETPLSSGTGGLEVKINVRNNYGCANTPFL